MRLLRTVIAAATCLLVVPAFAQPTLDRPLEQPQPFSVDSGAKSNTDGQQKSVHVETLEMPGAAWMRIYFGDVQLGPGSFLRITSHLDGEVQELDAQALEMWSHTSAYFNGDALDVELIAGPRTTGNRLVVEELAWEAAVAIPAGSCGICGADDRLPTNQDFAARLLPAGCSSTVYNTDSCLVTAGHCVGGGMVVQFRVPDSNSNCSLNNPPVADQFPITNFQFQNAGVGADWGVMISGTNNLGEKPIDRYGEFRPIATSPPSVGNTLDVWGYGIDSQCTRSQTQQQSDGTISGVGGTFINHDVDTTFGNSGSSMQRGGEILGIATHCGCPNVATRIDLPSFVSARESLCPVTVEPLSVPLSGVNVILGTLLAGGLSEIQDADADYVAVDAITQGVRNSAVTEVTAVSPDNTVSSMTVRVEVGPANADPVFLLIALFDFDTGEFDYVDFSIASTSASTTRNVTIANPNEYIDNSGNVRIRVAQTARLDQTPGGYTKLIDQVQVTVLP